MDDKSPVSGELSPGSIDNVAESLTQLPAPTIMPEGLGLSAGMPGPVGMAEQVPPRHPDNFVCLRGPCKHYWKVVTMMQSGNPDDTWEHLGIKRPRKPHHICLRGIEEMNLEDDNVFECSRWEPHLDVELKQLTVRREMYYKKHPEHRPIDNLDDLEI